jgi:cellulase (glycosyl hydrolase family 5)
MAACSTPSQPRRDREPIGGDALHKRISTELEGFTSWLERNGEGGYIGEVGWPGNETDAEQWNALAADWFSAADEAGLWVTGWATGEWWPPDYPLSMYVLGDSGQSIGAPSTQSDVLEAHLRASDANRGITVAGGEFGAPVNEQFDSFSNRNPGTYGNDYHFDSIETFQYIASRGIEIVRIPFRWERLQPDLGAPLDPDELVRLKGVVSRASSAGLGVVLDMHNYGAFYLADGERGARCPIGSQQCPISSFVDVWERISAAFEDENGVVAYGLMNEPVGLQPESGLSEADVWHEASQQALMAIRERGDDKLITVAGYFWSGVRDWTKWNPEPWIDDPSDHFLYEAHHYFDRDGSGSYEHSYADEVTAARSE